MNNLVSVVIPAYNGRAYLAQAIQSVLDQTYSNLQVVVVDDASQDGTVETVRQYHDPRVKYVRHEVNCGAVAARFTGVRESAGDIIAFLDQDDLFHREKVETHYNFFEKNPHIGATYNNRFELRDASHTPRRLWLAPKTVTLPDMVLGFPFAPSDIVLRREWASRPEIWDDSFATRAEHVIFNGQEIVCYGRLALEGCRFANVNRALNYRRYHSQRVLSHLAARCNAELACQEMIFDDSRCPRHVFLLRQVAFANTYVFWAYTGFVQGEIPLAQEMLEAAVRCKPSLIDETPCELAIALAIDAASDEREEPAAILQRVFASLPPSLANLEAQRDWAISRAYLFKGTEAALWDETEMAASHFRHATGSGSAIDEFYLQMITSLLLGVESELGKSVAQKSMANLISFIERIGGPAAVRRMEGHFRINRAFRHYQSGEYDRVPSDVFRGIANDPRYLMNRGVLAVSMRSILARVR